MGDLSGFTRFCARFESALQTYQKTMGVALAEHPLAMQLQSCHSADTIATLLKDESQVINDFLGSDRMMKSIRSTVSTLHTLSATACLGEAIGLVRPGALAGCSTSLTSLCSIPTCESNPCWPRYLICRMCRSLVPMCVFVVTSKWSRPPSA